MPGESEVNTALAEFWKSNAAYKEAVDAYLTMLHSASPPWWKVQAIREHVRVVHAARHHARNLYDKMLADHESVVRTAAGARTPGSAKEIEATKVALSESMVRSVLRDLGAAQRGRPASEHEQDEPTVRNVLDQTWIRLYVPAIVFGLLVGLLAGCGKTQRGIDNEENF